MNDWDKSKEELIRELQQLREAHHALKATIETDGEWHNSAGRKQAELLLHEMPERLNEVLENAVDASYKRNLFTNTYEYISPAFEQISGYTIDNMNTLPLEDVLKLIHPDDIPKTEKIVAEAMSDFSGKSHEVIQYEEALKKSETRYGRLLNSLEVGIVVHAPDTSIVMNNARASELLGLSDDQLRGKVAIDPAWKFIHEDKTPLILDEYPVNRIISGRQPIKNQLLGLCQPGKNEIVWLSVNGFPVLDKTGEITEILISFIEITERKQAEDKLQKSADLMEKTLFSLMDAVFIIDAGTVEIVDCNPAASAIFGYSRNEMLGQTTMFLHVNQTSLEEFRQHLNSDMEEGKDFMFLPEFRMKRKDGRVFFSEHCVVPLKNKQGQRMGWVSVVRDITERKQAEEALRKSEAIKNKMVSNIGDVIVIIDNDRINRYKSPNVEKWIGWKPEDLVGNSTWDNVHPDDLEAGQQFMLSLAGEPNACGTTELRYRKKDGNYCPIEITLVNLVHDPDIRGFLGNYHDISERKKAEYELLAAKEKAEESDRLKSAFLANMSHEIRTPLNSIIGFSELLGDADFPDDQKSEFIHHIISNGNNLLNVISDIVDISKIEARQITIRNTKIHVTKLLVEIKGMHKLQMEEKPIAFNCDCTCSESEIYVLADKERLHQVFNNLIINAFKFTSEGSIELGCRPVGDRVEFHVKDTGIGIAPEFHEKIFERFRQVDTEKTRKYGGNGLGLAITKNLIELMGGKLWLESEVGKGSTFYFTLPKSQ